MYREIESKHKEENSNENVLYIEKNQKWTLCGGYMRTDYKEKRKIYTFLYTICVCMWIYFIIIIMKDIIYSLSPLCVIYMIFYEASINVAI